MEFYFKSIRNSLGEIGLTVLKFYFMYDGQKGHCDILNSSRKTTLFVCYSSKYELDAKVKCLSVSWRGGHQGNVA